MTSLEAFELLLLPMAIIAGCAVGILRLRSKDTARKALAERDARIVELATEYGKLRYAAGEALKAYRAMERTRPTYMPERLAFEALEKILQGQD